MRTIENKFLQRKLKNIFFKILILQSYRSFFNQVNSALGKPILHPLTTKISLLIILSSNYLFAGQCINIIERKLHANIWLVWTTCATPVTNGRVWWLAFAFFFI